MLSNAPTSHTHSFQAVHPCSQAQPGWEMHAGGEVCSECLQ